MKAARAYVLQHRSWCTVSGLKEDATDYFVCTTSAGPVMSGPGFLFISKVTGRVREIAPGQDVAPGVDVFAKIERMTEVEGPSRL